MEKRFEKPVAAIVAFDTNDIIVTSGDYGDGKGILFPEDPADED